MGPRPARMSPQAAAWLKAEIEYIADRNPAAAQKIAARIRDARKNLGAFPKIGPAGLIPGTRRLVVAPYVLTVRERDGVIEIVAIRHTRQSDAYAPRGLLDEATDDGPPADTPTDDPSGVE
jgi:plasmid stabilization system protein ParE